MIGIILVDILLRFIDYDLALDYDAALRSEIVFISVLIVSYFHKEIGNYIYIVKTFFVDYLIWLIPMAIIIFFSHLLIYSIKYCIGDTIFTDSERNLIILFILIFLLTFLYILKLAIFGNQGVKKVNNNKYLLWIIFTISIIFKWYCSSTLSDYDIGWFFIWIFFPIFNTFIFILSYNIRTYPTKEDLLYSIFTKKDYWDNIKTKAFLFYLLNFYIMSMFISTFYLYETTVLGFIIYLLGVDLSDISTCLSNKFTWLENISNKFTWISNNINLYYINSIDPFNCDMSILHMNPKGSLDHILNPINTNVPDVGHGPPNLPPQDPNGPVVVPQNSGSQDEDSSMSNWPPELLRFIFLCSNRDNLQYSTPDLVVATQRNLYPYDIMVLLRLGLADPNIIISGVRTIDTINFFILFRTIIPGASPMVFPIPFQVGVTHGGSSFLYAIKFRFPEYSYLYNIRYSDDFSLLDHTLKASIKEHFNSKLSSLKDIEESLQEEYTDFAGRIRNLQRVQEVNLSVSDFIRGRGLIYLKVMFMRADIISDGFLYLRNDLELNLSETFKRSILKLMKDSNMSSHRIGSACLQQAFEAEDLGAKHNIRTPRSPNVGRLGIHNTA